MMPKKYLGLKLFDGPTLLEINYAIGRVIELLLFY